MNIKNKWFKIYTQHNRTANSFVVEWIREDDKEIVGLFISYFRSAAFIFFKKFN